MASCVSEIAGNIQLNCDSPIEGGYTGRAILIPMSAHPVLTREASNPRIISGIAIDQGAKVVFVDNEGANPFEGSGTTGNGESGRTRFDKVASLRMPERGANFAKNVVEPLVKSGRGFIGIFEKVDRVGDGSFEIVGSQSPLKVTDPTTVTRQENANGGAWSANMQCTEDYAEVVLLKTDYDDTLDYFESLVAQSF